MTFFMSDTLNISHCTHYFRILQTYHFTLQTSKTFLRWTQYLNGKMYLDVSKNLKKDSSLGLLKLMNFTKVANLIASGGFFVNLACCTNKKLLGLLKQHMKLMLSFFRSVPTNFLINQPLSIWLGTQFSQPNPELIPLQAESLASIDKK